MAITDRVHTSNQTFQYDALNRLTQASNIAGYGTLTYAYDPTGNLTEKDGRRLSYDRVFELVDPIQGLWAWTKPHAVTSTSDGLAFTYDRTGNLLQRAEQASGRILADYTYDAENRLVVAGGGAATEQTVMVSLRAGWNVFSLPLVPQDRTIAAIFGVQLANVKQVSRREPVTDTWGHFVNDPVFNQFDTLEVGVGYAVYTTAPITLTLTGSPLSAATSRTLPAGPSSTPPSPP
jgi:YD repeat-containing protein